MLQLDLFGEVVGAEAPLLDEDGLELLTSERVDEDVLITLQYSTVAENRVYLPRDLERSHYLQVNEVLARLGGKWKRTVAAHVFPYDPKPLVTAVIESGRMPEKNPSAFFPTPDRVIDCMFDWPGIGPLDWDEYRVLEPSAGQGAIARRLVESFPSSPVHVCELVGLNRQVLVSKGFDVVGRDFLTYQPATGYDLIMMNPPFAVKGDRLAYMSHITHAWEMLRGNGRLVSITPVGWTYGTESKAQEFRKLVCDYGEFEELEEGAFKGSGTGVRTVLIWMEKPADGQSWKRKPYQNFNSHHSWNVGVLLESDYQRHKTYWEIVQALADGRYSMDLAGAPLGRAKESLIYLFQMVERDANEGGGAVFLDEADIEFLLMKAAREAMEVRSNE